MIIIFFFKSVRIEPCVDLIKKNPWYSTPAVPLKGLYTYLKWLIIKRNFNTIAICINFNLIRARIYNANNLIKVAHFDLLPWCPIFQNKTVISFIISTLGTLLYAYLSVAFNGNFSTENCFQQYWKLTEKFTKSPWKTRSYALL